MSKKANLHTISDPHGKALGVLITVKQYEKLMDILDDYHDYLAVLKHSSAKKERTYTQAELLSELNKTTKRH